ncbi:RNA-binding protein 45-like isoform X2 [Nerophis lumbriciformis]|uniref:RNA-binding protein 45-like isoform X2 n=1 Tax=Nerophis lumbriciformis TaxID=546530 RepID=UPI002ADF6991|nr:RNA-binding protein 45-like isoform X2 [Nerophis lumbriciformis]
MAGSLQIGEIEQAVMTGVRAALQNALPPVQSTPSTVFIAQSRSSTSHRDVEDEELTRIFVMIPKTFSEEDLKNTFKEYGDIEYCVIIKNKMTGESKGLGYVRYHKPSQAAVAIENCDKAYRAILAEPRSKPPASEEYMGGATSRSDYTGAATAAADSMNQYPFTMSSAEPTNYTAMDYRSGDFTCCLMVSTRAALTQEQIFNLFDIIPGMEYCELQRDAYGMGKADVEEMVEGKGEVLHVMEAETLRHSPVERQDLMWGPNGKHLRVARGHCRATAVPDASARTEAVQKGFASWSGRVAPANSSSSGPKQAAGSSVVFP